MTIASEGVMGDMADDLIDQVLDPEFDYFRDGDVEGDIPFRAEGPGDCPKCGGPTQLRTGKHGKFYGCCDFPKCRGSRYFVNNLHEEFRDTEKKWRSISVNIPTEVCNRCIFFSTRVPDPEECPGGWGTRSYRCRRFGKDLEPDYKRTYRKYGQDPERVVRPLEECLKGVVPQMEVSGGNQS